MRRSVLFALALLAPLALASAGEPSGTEVRNGRIAFSVEVAGYRSNLCLINPNGTKRPQNATIEAAGRAMGKERYWRDIVRRRGA